MIKIERKMTEKAEKAIESLQEAKMKNSTYNTPEVNAALQEIYYGSTAQKKVEAIILRRTLRKELSKFKEYVREYQEAEDVEKEDLRYLLKQQLGDNSPFVAFKRWLIRDHQEAYPELLTYIDS